MPVAVRAMAPVAAMPPKNGQTTFPTPSARSSASGSCLVPAMPSATTAERSDSMAPSTAMASADGSNGERHRQGQRDHADDEAGEHVGTQIARAVTLGEGGAQAGERERPELGRGGGGSAAVGHAERRRCSSPACAPDWKEGMVAPTACKQEDASNRARA